MDQFAHVQEGTSEAAGLSFACLLAADLRSFTSRMLLSRQFSGSGEDPGVNSDSIKRVLKKIPGLEQPKKESKAEDKEGDKAIALRDSRALTRQLIDLACLQTMKQADPKLAGSKRKDPPADGKVSALDSCFCASFVPRLH